MDENNDDEIEKLSAEELRKIQEQKEKAEKEQLRLSLIEGPEELLKQKATDKALDRQNERIQLQGGGDISIAGWNLFLKKSAQAYGTQFILEYFERMYVLKGWKKEDAKKYNKPFVVGDYNNELIYMRFPPAVLPALQENNPYVRFAKREFKHYQFLPAEGIIQLKGFIRDAIDLMKECKTWYEFREKYGKKYNVPYQSDAFNGK